MERRVLLAIFLAFLVLYGYQMLVVPPPPPEGAAAGSPAPGVGTGAPEQPTAVQPAAAPATPPPPPAEPAPATAAGRLFSGPGPTIAAMPGGTPALPFTDDTCPFRTASVAASPLGGLPRRRAARAASPRPGDLLRFVKESGRGRGIPQRRSCPVTDRRRAGDPDPREDGCGAAATPSPEVRRPAPPPRTKRGPGTRAPDERRNIVIRRMLALGRGVAPQ